MKNKLKYGIIGSGALGGYYGAMLAHSGEDVYFLFNKDYNYVKENGFRVDSCRGDMFFSPNEINAYNSTSEMPQCDVVIVALKTTNNHLLKNILPPLLHSSTLVLMIQNGLGVEEDLAQYLPNTPIAGGLAFLCSNKVGAGHINHLDYGKLSLAMYNDSPHNILDKVIEDFRNSGVTVESMASLAEARWRKLMWNIPYNGMSVALCTTTDSLMNNPSSREIIRDLMLEVREAANAQEGVFIEEEAVENLLYATENMTPYLPSMRLDFDAKRPMEIEYIYSRAIAKAKAQGISMSKTTMLRDMLQFIESTYRDNTII